MPGMRETYLKMKRRFARTPFKGVRAKRLLIYIGVSIVGIIFHTSEFIREDLIKVYAKRRHLNIIMVSQRVNKIIPA